MTDYQRPLGRPSDGKGRPAHPTEPEGSTWAILGFVVAAGLMVWLPVVMLIRAWMR